MRAIIPAFTSRFEGSKEVIVHLNGVYYPCSYWAEKVRRMWRACEAAADDRSSEQGMRPYMEDRFQMCKGRGAEDSSCYAVFDGHGGVSARRPDMHAGGMQS